MNQWQTSPWIVASIIFFVVGVASWLNVGLPFVLFGFASLLYGAAYISRNRGLWGKLMAFTFVFIGISAFSAMSMVLIPGQFFVHLLTGWLSFLSDVVFRAEMNWSEIGFFFVLLTVFSAGLHSFCAWLYGALNEQGTAWKFTWTGSITGLIFLLFMTTMSTVGIAHQMAWFNRHPPAENSWDNVSYQTRLACSKMNSSVGPTTSTSSESLRNLQQELDSLTRRPFNQLRLSVLRGADQQAAGILVLPKYVLDHKPDEYIAFCRFSDWPRGFLYNYAQLDELIDAISHRGLEELKTKD